MLSVDSVLNALRNVIEPHSGKDIVRLGWVRELKIEGNAISFTLLLADPTIDFAGEVKSESIRALSAQFPDHTYSIEQDSPMIGLGGDFQIDGKRQKKVAGDGVTNIIAIASGKGGVGNILI